MLPYYGLILLSVFLFGGGFAVQDLYRKKRGSRLKNSMEATCIGSLAGLLVLLAVNGFSFDFTTFTFLMAVLAALNGMAFTFCAFQALNYINLSLFSLFAMLGGMVLPFLQGIFFYEEGFTVEKAVCVVFICAALLCTVERSDKKRGTVFYVGVFALNGMSGVISKLFTEGEFPKTSAAGYSIWIATVTMALSGVAWLALSVTEGRRAENGSAGRGKISAGQLQAYGLGALYGAINQVANFLLIVALAHVDASVQYPMVAGGTMIVSTAFSLFGERKPTKREIASIGLAFVGMLSLVLCPT